MVLHSEFRLASRFVWVHPGYTYSSVHLKVKFTTPVYWAYCLLGLLSISFLVFACIFSCYLPVLPVDSSAFEWGSHISMGRFKRTAFDLVQVYYLSLTERLQGSKKRFCGPAGLPTVNLLPQSFSPAHPTHTVIIPITKSQHSTIILPAGRRGELAQVAKRHQIQTNSHGTLMAAGETLHKGPEFGECCCF